MTANQPMSSGQQTATLEAGASAGRWLRLASALWLACALASVVILLLAIPGYLARTPMGSLGAHLVPNTAPLFVLSTRLVSLLGFSSALLSLLLATLIFRRRPDDGFALFVAFYLLMNGILVAGPIEMLEFYGPNMTAVNSFILLPLLQGPMTAALVATFPDGRFVPRWTPWLILLSLIFAPITIYLYPQGQSEVAGIPLNAALFLLWAGSTGALIYAQIYRYRNVASLEQRQQTKWIVYGFILSLLALGVSSLIWRPALALPAGALMPWWLAPTELIFVSSTLFVPIALTVAVLRYQLWRIDLVINRTLVYGALTTCVIALYVLVVGLFSTLFQAQGSTLTALIATGLVAVLFQPLRQRLQRGANRLMYGDRDDPNLVLGQLGRQLEATLAPDQVLPTIVETVAETLKLPFVAIQLWQGDRFTTTASRGRPRPDALRLPLVYQAETLGYLLVAARAGESFNAADRALLQNVARQAGVAAHAVRLTADLQRSRQQLVSAREEERRRLRRDLHDGLGSSLAAIHLQAGVLRRLIRRQPASAEEMADEFRQEIRTAIDEIRRVVYALRPPALDDLGLVAAIQAHADQIGRRPGAAGSAAVDLQVQVDTPAPLPPLPAAVEVAAYRIVQEALTNVVHHARASNCQISLSLSEQAEQLEVSVLDNGIGLAPGLAAGLAVGHTNGLGLLSMRERATELGGRFQAGPAQGGGTRVWAALPLPAE